MFNQVAFRINVLNEVITIVKKIAQHEVMPRFLQVARQIKADGSTFTEADLAAQDALIEALQKIRSGPVLGEEMPQKKQEAQWSKGNEGLWSVDPIDGTSNFLNGIPYFAISVARMEQGRSVLGVIYNPVSDEMFYAEKGGGGLFEWQTVANKT